MISFKQFLENEENSSQQDVRQEIFNSPIPDNLKELFKAVNNYNRQSDRNTLFHLMPKYDNMDLPNLDSHGISKISRSFQLNSLIKFLEDGKIPTSMHSAPLLKGRNESFGAGIGTASGTAYRDGLFIIVATPGKTLHEEIKYVIVDGQVADSRFQENGMNPTQLQQSFIRGIRHKKSFQFLIKWSGYEEPTWIAFKDAKRLVQFPGYVSVFSGLNML
jgi:hypothetical protein